MLAAYQHKIIELMIEQERLISQIYQMFAEHFPLHKEFWLGLASREMERAEWIDHLHKMIEKEKASFDEGKVKSYTLTAFITYLENIIAEIKINPNLKISRAFFLAKEISSALMERNIFTRFEGHSREIKEILALLEKDTKENLIAIDKYLSFAKCNSPTWS